VDLLQQTLTGQIWSTTSYLRLYALWSTYDVGDIFCVAYSSYHHTVYLGAQNTSIQVWVVNTTSTTAC
jgi:hypothetical protein